MRLSRGTWFVLLLVIVVLIIVLMVVNSNKNNTQNNNNNQNQSGNITSQNLTQSKQGDVEVTNVNITSDGTMTSVDAQVTNNSSVKYSMVDISVIFYDESKNVLATAKGLIENLDAGDNKRFSSTISGDFTKTKSYEVKIDKAE